MKPVEPIEASRAGVPEDSRPLAAAGRQPKPDLRKRRAKQRLSSPRIILFSGLLLAAGWGGWRLLSPAIPSPPEGSWASILDISILVFREGLECVLVLAAVTAGMGKSGHSYERPIAAGAGMGFAATLATWFIAVGIIDDLSQSIPALDVQAATGLLAVFVLVIVMNWFFHKVYWTGWISMHNKRKWSLLERRDSRGARRLFWGFCFLGFTSLYREGVEVVLFLQSFRLKLGGTTVLYGAMLGLFFAGIVAVLTFAAHRRLPYRRMLILTGVLLGGVLLVMVGEQVQEMQLAHWLPSTTLPALVHIIPSWMGLWFSIFPNLETLLAQALALVLVLGSYVLARVDWSRKPARSLEPQLEESPGVNSANVR